MTTPAPQQPGKPSHALTIDAAMAYLNDLGAMLNGTGRHADHKRSQIGRCVYCECGLRAQGRMSTPRAPEPRREP